MRCTNKHGGEKGTMRDRTTKEGEGREEQECFFPHTCTASIHASYKLPAGAACERVQMSKSVGPDIKQTLPCRLPGTKCVSNSKWAHVWREFSLENFKQASGHVDDASIPDETNQGWRGIFTHRCQQNVWLGRLLLAKANTKVYTVRQIQGERLRPQQKKEISTV